MKNNTIIKKRLKVLILYHPVLDSGGVEKHIAQLINELEGERLEFFLLSNTSRRFLEKLVLVESNILPWESKDLFSQSNFGQFQKIGKSIKPDIIHAHSPSAALFSMISRIPGGKVQTIHLNYPDFFGGDGTTLWRIFRRIISTILQKLSYYIFANTIMVSKNEYHNKPRIQLLDGKISYISNAVTSFENVGVKDSNTVKIISTGRLTYQKGFDILLMACSQIAHLNFELNIFGDGELRTDLETYIQENSLGDKCFFHGYSENVQKELEQADIFVLPSRYEGAPYSLLEALAMGLPCIASSIGDIPNIIEENKTGLLFPSGSVNDLASQMEKLIQSKRLRENLGNLGQKRQEEEFNISKTKKQLAKLYEGIVREE